MYFIEINESKQSIFQKLKLLIVAQNCLKMFKNYILMYLSA